MAKVRCSCGREYNFPDEHLGKRVTCAKCGNTFVARAAADGSLKPDTAKTKPVRAAGSRAASVAPAKPESGPPPRPASAAAPKPAPSAPAKPVPAGKRRIGDRAVAAHLVTREQLDACLHYQQALRKIPGEGERRLGEILVEKKLISKTQLQRLLAGQGGGTADAISAATDLPPRKGTRTHPITDERREAIRLSVESAAHQAEEQERAAREAKEQAPSRLARLRAIHFAIPVAAIVALIALIKLWPAPAAERTLVKYLTSCDEANIQPDASLATRDLGLSLREFKDVELLSSTTYDYAAELHAAQKSEDTTTWKDLLGKPELSPDKRKALELLLPALPGDLTPDSLSNLKITVQPATSELLFKQRGTSWFHQGRFRFLLVKASSPRWRCDWKVAAVERDEPASPTQPAEAPKKQGQ